MGGNIRTLNLLKTSAIDVQSARVWYSFLSYFAITGHELFFAVCYSKPALMKDMNWDIWSKLFSATKILCKMNILTVVCILLSRVSPFSTVDIVQLRGSTCCSQKLIQISCILMSGLSEPVGGTVCLTRVLRRHFLGIKKVTSKLKSELFF